jgi:hypothetical protein
MCPNWLRKHRGYSSQVRARSSDVIPSRQAGARASLRTELWQAVECDATVAAVATVSRAALHRPVMCHVSRPSTPLRTHSPPFCVRDEAALTVRCSSLKIVAFWYVMLVSHAALPVLQGKSDEPRSVQVLGAPLFGHCDAQQCARPTESNEPRSVVGSV